MIALPEPGPLAMPLGEALLSRRSRYRYEPVGLAALGSLLGWAVGVQRHVDGHVLGMNPTAGGLPSLAVHVVRDGEVLEYLRAEHALRPVGAGSLEGVFTQPEFESRASTVVVLSGLLGPGLEKYGEVHQSTVRLDGGIALQNLYLVGTALGLRCCAVAGFDVVRVRELAGGEGDPLALFVVG
ncbi:nitroreductase family protein [Actinokineospora pegani]|uniref:nitroreductase family protein n=1 Tax=Actinokineospora pegani TaxID=2654637 RepID=UPI0012EA6EEB|nr:nitroreductase family protein [Actinokineospora pegani]